MAARPVLTEFIITYSPPLFRVNIKFPVIERPSLPVAGEISSFRIYIYKAHRIKLIEAWNCFQFDCATGGTSNYRHRIAMCRLVEFTARKVALPFICNLFPLWYRAVTKLDSLYGIFFFFLSFFLLLFLPLPSSLARTWGISFTRQKRD